MSSFTITPIVRQAVEHRLEELERTKKSFERRHFPDTDQSEEPNVFERLQKLLEDIKNLDQKLDEENGEWLSETIERCIEQAQDDKAISEKKLLRLEKSLRDKLSRFRNRLEVSCLHAQLMKQATDAPKIDTATAKLEVVALDDDDFDVVDNEWEEVLEKFEAACSQPTNVDSHSIETYLSSLFATEANRLQCIRDGMQAYGEDLRSGEFEMNEDTLTWIMKDLMRSERISQERKETLANYSQSPDALRELVATMRMMNHRDWDYRNKEMGLPTDVLKTTSGQHYVHVEVDLIDMLFLHCSAIGWAIKLNECLKDFVHDSDLFRSTPLTEADLDKRSFFFDVPRLSPSMIMTCGAYQSPPPPPLPYMCHQMPPPLPLGKSKKCTRSKKKSQGMYAGMQMVPSPPMPPPPPDAFVGVNNVRRDEYERYLFMSRLPKQSGDVPKMVSPEEVQARLIKTLAAECQLRKTFDGKAYASTVELDSLASTVPHDTIIAVLGFLGVPVVFLDFFTRALEPKLNIKSSSQDVARVLTPKSGVSVGNGLEMFFTEAVLFFFEVATRKATESYMYRLYDRCYFVGTEAHTINAEKGAVNFSDIMGLKLRNTSTDGLSIGLLTMNSQESLSLDTSPEFRVDDAKVALYATQIEARLKACSTVLEWIREWNNTVGTYAAHLFGPLANVFGATHREAVKAAYKRIHSIVLGGKDLTTYVTEMLKPHTTRDREAVSIDLEPIIYLPQAYGGLGVKTPFVTLAFASKISNSGSEKIEDYLKEEAACYTRAAERYNRVSACERQQKLQTIFNNDTSRMVSALGPEVTSGLCLAALPFMTEAEMTEHRERAPYPVPVPEFWNGRFTAAPPDLVSLYRGLLNEPSDGVEESQKTMRDVNRLSRSRDLRPWFGLSQDDRWMLQLYSDEYFEQYGGLDIWWAEGIPVEVYNNLRGQMSDDDYGNDDCNTVC